ncbi:MAG: DUF4160 domain-containing protein [Chitinophagaceae bacterium]|nr:MAG: DUF4160 domain-containing protein [Chitinophagaceae bacterium]
MHVHVSNTKSRKGKSAKIWLDTLEVFEQGSLTSKEINTALKLLEKYGPQIAKRITEFATEGKINVLHLSLKQKVLRKSSQSLIESRFVNKVIYRCFWRTGGFCMCH